MKKILLFFALILSLNTFAQTQQGVVKTRGRVVNGKVVAGSRLNGATVTLSLGSTHVSGAQGLFSFSVPPSKSFSLVSASLKGYTLADPEYKNRSFRYSASNTFYVVLEDENQRQADINAATRKVRKTLTAQLDKREKEIEDLKLQNKLTEKEYQKRLQELYDNQSRSEQLVKEMAERYATTDYDQFDDFNRQVQMYIEDGELQKADSMIRSKGDMEQRVAAYHETVAANKKVREELEQSESGAAKTYEDIAQDLYRRYEIYMQKFQQDSALYCLKMRADLDTTKASPAFEYANLCHKQKKYDDCEKYYHICLRLFLKNPESYRAEFAAAQNNLGSLYKDLHDYSSSAKYYKLALANRELLFAQNPDAYRADLAATQNNLGNLYKELYDYSSSEKYYKLSLENYELLFTQKPDAYRADLAAAQNNLGNLYLDIHDYSSSEKYYKLALENREQLFAQNPDAYRDNLATTQNNLGVLYMNLNDYSSSEKYYKLALENREQLFAKNPDAYRSSIALLYSNIMVLSASMKNFAQYGYYLDKSLEQYAILYSSQPNVYKDDLIDLKKRKFWQVETKGNIEEALNIAKEIYALDETNGELKIYLAECYNQIAYSYFLQSDFANAHLCVDKAITLFPTSAGLYDSKGRFYLMEGKNDEALKMWRKVLELNPDFLKERPDGTDLSKGLKKRGLIE